MVLKRKTMQKTEQARCCVCNNKNYKFLKKVRFGNASLNLVKCKCGLVFFSPRLSKDYIEKLYSEDKLDQLSHNKAYSEEDKIEFNQRLGIAAKYGRKGSVLDMGCSTGTFLLCCKEKKYKQLYGVDLNRKTNDYCKKQLGLDVGISLPKKKFDLIHASDLIEHLQEPDSFIKSIRQNLNDNGLIMLTTPNINNPVNKLVNIKPREHLYYFSRKTIRVLLEKNGFEVLLIKSRNRYHPLKHLANTSSADRLKEVIKLILALKLDGIVNKLVLKNLYLDLLVIARKKN
jgi:2-polyprenyl-3-methyl-5-hydroxy-6-metoxy-1,4-benzoquinol methylase